MNGPIVFDGAVLGDGPPTGVARSFLDGLAACAATASRSLVLLLPPHAEHPQIDHLQVVRTSAVTSALRRIAQLPWLLRRLRAGLLHSPVAAVPVHAPCPMIATVHDVPWRADSPLDEPATGLRHRIAARLALARATVVIVPSHATLEDLRAAFPRGRAELVVVPHGVPLPSSAEAILEHDGPFLVIGDDRPRKNLDRVRRAHGMARARHADLPPLERIGPGARFVAEGEKHALLRHARAVLQVSLHEGFGLPVVEAFGHGTPVLCSDRKSLPEIAAGAALLVDPEDEDAIADAIVRIHTDGALRTRLSAEGRRRAAELTPEHVAARWHAIHRRLLSCR